MYNKLRRSTIKERIVICGFLLYFSSAGSWRNALFGTEPSWTRCHWFSIGLNWHGKIPLFGKAIAGLWYSCCHHQVSININFVSLFTSFLPMDWYQLFLVNTYSKNLPNMSWLKTMPSPYVRYSLNLLLVFPQITVWIPRYILGISFHQRVIYYYLFKF